jgi:hypothetical protein
MIETELVERLERLERDNWRLKAIVVSSLVVVAAFGAVYAARPAPPVIKAHALEVVDARGVVRAAMTEDPVQGASLSLGFHEAPAAFGLPRGSMVPDVTINDPPSSGPGVLVRLASEGRGFVGLGVSPKGQPNVELQDAAGFTMDLGTANTVTSATGATQRTSAASIVMFGNDKDHHVIWQAP